jgi:adenine-specific DNA-methyltransferase
MTEQLVTKREEVRALLRKLFRSDQEDLDFGIYRIMNYKRDKIEEFIEKGLFEVAEAEFKQFSMANTSDLERELEVNRERIESLLGSGVFNSVGDPVKYNDTKAIQEYEDKRKQIKSATITEEQVNDVFSHIYEFFSRYYEDGDYIPNARYGRREKYYVPYNGEEVVLHWATKDMYYVKTGEHLRARA